MNSYSLSHLSDQTLLRDLAELVARDRATTAVLLAHLAEVDERRLYLPAAYPSMYAYCVEELRLSEEAACKRIRAARAARQFPVLFGMLADGRLHLTAVVMLAPHLTPENADQILAAAANQSKAGIDLLLAERFPRPDLTARIEAIPPVLPVAEQGPGAIEQPAPGRVEAAVPRPKVAPLAAERYALQVTIDQRTHDQLRYAQALLSHRIPSGDLAQVLGRVLRVAIAQLEKQKFAGSDLRRRASRRPPRNARHVPAHVRRAVWQRDGGQCTFVSENGHRCAACNFLEFDHVDPVARGGQATVHGMRLRCRAHNQYGAECAYGAEFMSRKRHQARRASSEARRGAAGQRPKEQDSEPAMRQASEPPMRQASEQAMRQASEQAKRQARERAQEVIPWLRRLGFRADEARRAAALCVAV